MDENQPVEDQVREFLDSTDSEWPFVFITPAENGPGDIVMRTGSSQARHEQIPKLAGLFILALSEFSDSDVYEVAEDVAGYAEAVQDSDQTVTYIRE